MPRRLSRAIVVAGALCLVTWSADPAGAASAPNDPDFRKQYGPVQIGAVDAWDKSTGKDVIVAVVDSGVDREHPEFAGKLVILAGSDLADSDSNPDDDTRLPDGKLDFPHGTAVAGVIGAVTNNGEGIAGVAPDVKVMPLKVFPSGGQQNLQGVLTNVVRAVRMAVDNGAKVINLSLGNNLPKNALVGTIETPCLEAYNRGSLCVVSSGNSRSEQPASGYSRDASFLNVTANDADGNGAAFAQNADTKWGVSAPGVGVYTTASIEAGDYTTTQGTSFSAPHAAGVAALLFGQGLRASQVVQRILDTATPMGDPTRNGAGRVDAAAGVGVQRTFNTTNTTQRTSGSVLLPKAATNTTVVRKAPTATQPGGAPVVTTAGPGATTPTGGQSDAEFEADFSNSGTPEEGLAIGAARGQTDTGDLGFYSLITVAVLLLLGTGVALPSAVRKRRSGT